MRKFLRKILKGILEDNKESNKASILKIELDNIKDFEKYLSNNLKQDLGITQIRVKKVQYGFNIYIYNILVLTIYWNQYYDITRIVYNKYNLYFTPCNEKNKYILNILENIDKLDINKIKTIINDFYLSTYKK